MKRGLNDRFWCCKLTEVRENQVVLTVKPSVNSLIGRWTVFAQTSFFVRKNSLIVAEIYIKCTFLCMYVDDCCFCWQEIPDGEEKKSFHRYKHFGKLYVIFNPFNIGAWYLWREIMLSISHLIYRCLSWLDDAVYMEDEMERDEYVMAENGRIYTGNSRQIYGRPWNFGQVNCSFSTKLWCNPDAVERWRFF